MAYAITDIQPFGRNHINVTYTDDGGPATTVLFSRAQLRQQTSDMDFATAFLAMVRIGLPERGTDIKVLTPAALRSALVGKELAATRLDAKIAADEAAKKGG